MLNHSKSSNKKFKQDEINQKSKNSFISFGLSFLPNYREFLSGGFVKINADWFINLYNTYTKKSGGLDPYQVNEIIREVIKLFSACNQKDKEIGHSGYVYNLDYLTSPTMKVVCKASFFVKNILYPSHQSTYSHYLGEPTDYLCDISAKFLKTASFSKQDHEKLDETYKKQNLFLYILDNFSLSWVSKSILEPFIIIPTKRKVDDLLKKIIDPLKAFFSPFYLDSFFEGSLKSSSFFTYAKIVQKLLDCSFDFLSSKTDALDNQHIFEQNNNNHQSNVTSNTHNLSIIKNGFTPSRGTDPSPSHFQFSSKICNSTIENKSMYQQKIGCAHKTQNTALFYNNDPTTKYINTEHLTILDNPTTSTINLFSSLELAESSFESFLRSNYLTTEVSLTPYALNANECISPEIIGANDQCIYPEAFTWPH